MGSKRKKPVSGPHVPFVFIEGRPHLVVNFELEPRGDLPALRELLEGLLKHHREGEVPLLRPLGVAEARLLRRSTEAAEVEAWAQIAARPEDRLRARGKARSMRRSRKR